MKITEETKIKDLIPEGWELNADDYISFMYDSSSLNELKIPIKKKKSKILEDYENKLMATSCPGAYQILKDLHPKQYYSIILEMIRNDICEEGKERCHILFKHPDNNCIKSIPLRANYLGTVKFDTEKHAKQAQKIMGYKLKYLL